VAGRAPGPVVVDRARARRQGVTIDQAEPQAGAQSAARRGTNLPRMGDFNESVILDAIRRAPGG